MLNMPKDVVSYKDVPFAGPKTKFKISEHAWQKQLFK